MRRKIAWRRIEQPFERRAFGHLSLIGAESNPSKKLS
jgi:hypothetical protein